MIDPIEKSLWHWGMVYSVAISSDDKYVVLGSWNKKIRVWEIESGKRLKTLKGHTNVVSSVAISKNSKYIISGSWDGSIKIWNTKSGKLVKEFIAGKSGCWQSIDFEASPPVLYRGDDGIFLLKKRELYRDGNRSSYALEPAYFN